ncbi:unnamed protein product [Owenia fusiformis]|uniref:Uncharacterized protein n=1 Tax=Owenia fusiformis TaxID=6347 RepID=A0A8S4MZY5_OWEFU|nr:unnamed protein product [Owenia fusiformis]
MPTTPATTTLLLPKTRSYHAKSVRPDAKVGMHLNLHKNIDKRFRPTYVTIDYKNGPESLELIDIVLARQRPFLRSFSGRRMYSAGQVYTHVDHIAQSDPYRIAESKGFMIEEREAPGVPRLIKKTPDEVDAIIDRITKFDPRKHPADSRGRCGRFTPAQEDRDQRPTNKYSNDDVKAIVERLSKFDPEKVPESKGPIRGTPTKMDLPIIYKKNYTEDEVHAIIDRLIKYDPSKWPPESRGKSPTFLQEVTKQKMTTIKKCKPFEVEEIVDRLMQFNPQKWPPESKRFNPNRSTTVCF